MAEARKALIDTEKLLESVNCEICMTLLVNPRSLPCNHTYCKGCLDDWLTFNDDGSAILTCPSNCPGVKTFNPKETTSSLPRNYSIDRVIDFIWSTKKSIQLQCESNIKCINSVNVVCMICCKKLCQDCSKKHSCEEKTFIHIRFDERTEKLQSFCLAHDALCTHVCKTCNSILLCVYCLHRNHKGHNAQTISALSTELISSFTSEIDKIYCDDDKTETIDAFENALKSELKNRKLLLLATYLTELNEEENKILDIYQNSLMALREKIQNNDPPMHALKRFLKKVESKESFEVVVLFDHLMQEYIQLLDVQCTEMKFDVCNKKSLGVLSEKIYSRTLSVGNKPHRTIDLKIAKVYKHDTILTLHKKLINDFIKAFEFNCERETLNCGGLSNSQCIRSVKTESHSKSLFAEAPLNAAPDVEEINSDKKVLQGIDGPTAQKTETVKTTPAMTNSPVYPVIRAYQPQEINSDKKVLQGIDGATAQKTETVKTTPATTNSPVFPVIRAYQPQPNSSMNVQMQPARHINGPVQPQLHRSNSQSYNVNAQTFVPSGGNPNYPNSSMNVQMQPTRYTYINGKVQPQLHMNYSQSYNAGAQTFVPRGSYNPRNEVISSYHQTYQPVQQFNGQPFQYSQHFSYQQQPQTYQPHSYMMHQQQLPPTSNAPHMTTPRLQSVYQFQIQHDPQATQMHIPETGQPKKRTAIKLTAPNTGKDITSEILQKKQEKPASGLTGLSSTAPQDDKKAKIQSGDLSHVEDRLKDKEAEIRQVTYDREFLLSFQNRITEKPFLPDLEITLEHPHKPTEPLQMNSTLDHVHAPIKRLQKKTYCHQIDGLV